MKLKTTVWAFIAPGLILAGTQSPAQQQQPQVVKQQSPVVKQQEPVVKQQEQLPMPKTLIVKVKQGEQQGQEIEATVIGINSDIKVTNEQLAQQANAALQSEETMNLSEQGSAQAPKEIQGFFDLQNLIAVDAIQATQGGSTTDSRNHWGYYGRHGFYGYGYPGYYGYAYPHYYHHANYGYWWNGYMYPYVNYGYYYPYGGYNYYYYNNPYYY